MASRRIILEQQVRKPQFIPRLYVLWASLVAADAAMLSLSCASPMAVVGLYCDCRGPLTRYLCTQQRLDVVFALLRIALFLGDIF
jgi:hypothetical protein